MHLFAQSDDERNDRVISFPGRGAPDGEPAPRRSTARPRRARRRRQNTPWLQRNALSIAGISILVAFLGLGFGLAQLIARPEPAPQPALLVVPNAEPAPTAVTAGALTPAAAQPAAAAPDGPRAIQANATVLEANYTVQSGDTLGQIATRFNTTVERIAALNNLADPRVLRVGAKLVIPPPF